MSSKLSKWANFSSSLAEFTPEFRATPFLFLLRDSSLAHTCATARESSSHQGEGGPEGMQLLSSPSRPLRLYAWRACFGVLDAKAMTKHLSGDVDMIKPPSLIHVWAGHDEIGAAKGEANGCIAPYCSFYFHACMILAGANLTETKTIKDICDSLMGAFGSLH